MRETLALAASIRSHICLLSLLLCLLFLSLPISHCQPVTLRGIRKRDHSAYSGTNFTCLDASASFPSSRVNDDYCDCADGSDEPGTSACSNSAFFCANRGASPLTLHSSRVNDLICDCCDGSDEWASAASCANRCAEEGREAHKHILEEIAATEAGVKTRERLAAEAAQLKADKEAKRAKYEALVAERQKLVDAAKDALTEQEKVEQVEKDRLKAIEDEEAAVAAEAARVQAEQQSQQQQPVVTEGQPAATEQLPTAESLTLAEQPEEDTTAVPADQQQEAQAPLGNTETSAGVHVVASSAQRTMLHCGSWLTLSSILTRCALTLCSPDAALPDAQPAENFPYPAEYAFKPTEDAAPHHSTPAAAEPIIEQEVENFPYPAEYAYQADAIHTATQLPPEEVYEEDEQPADAAGAQATEAGQQQPQEPAAAAEPAKVTSATYTLEGETQQHSLTQRLTAAVGRLVDGVSDAMPEVPPVLYEVLKVYADGWRWLMKRLFPRPLTPAEGERPSRRQQRVAGTTTGSGR